jgi:omega-hydroxy-beta-dihydromenaquinone-9 sulfotransferase
MENRKPIIIVGAGRSGSTIFYRTFARHPNLAWLPAPICTIFPGKPALCGLCIKGIDLPVVGNLLSRTLRPSECYPFWQHHCRGFSIPYRDLRASDVTEKTKKHLRSTMPELLTEKRDRLLIKITGWPRIGFLSHIFQDAKFIHVLRDGRAVVNSLINVDFWQGWRGLGNWRFGELSPAQREEWDRYDQSFVVLAALQWKILMDAMEEAKASINQANFLEVKYEHLCSDPIGSFRRVVEFSELNWAVGFERDLREIKVRNTNEKFRQDLTAKQQSDVENVLKDYLKRYNYM